MLHIEPRIQVPWDWMLQVINGAPIDVTVLRTYIDKAEAWVLR
jgi:hypothetical protein